MKRDNYLHMRNEMRSRFLTYDQSEMIRKFSLKSDGEFLYLTFLSRPYRVGRHTGIVEWSEDNFLTCIEGDYSESMTIYDVLCYSKPDCCLSGTFTQSNSLPGTAYTRLNTGSGSFYDRQCRFFDDKLPALREACAALGGIPEGKGDVAYRIPLFDFLPLRFAFWQSDEDFPAEIKIFWDSNTLNYMHFETLWFAVGHMLKRIAELMSVTPPSKVPE